MSRSAAVFFGVVAALAVAPVLAQPSAAGVPARYLVFELDSEGAPRPQSHQVVLLRQAPSSRPKALAEGAADARHGGGWRVEMLGRSGELVFEDLARPTLLRAEQGLHGESGGAEVFEGQQAFALRLPLVAGSRLRLTALDNEGAGSRASVELDLDALAADPGLPLQPWVARATAKGPRFSSSGNRADLLVMGDGYTAAEEAKFAADASQLLASFFDRTPYHEYRDFVSTATLFTPSGQSGADHPSFSSSCSATTFPSCCSDPLMQNDPLAGSFVTTAFDATYCSFNIHRLLVVRTAKVLTAAAAAPDWDKILVLVNDPTYGGTGGAQVGCLSVHPSAVELAQHEFGHTFTGLADEYTTASPDYPPCSDRAGSGNPCEPNVTDATGREAIKWSPWILGSTPLPTPSGDPTEVGLFEGARYLTSGMYRPQEHCLMASLAYPFCKVCTEAFIVALYRGGWGVPEAGIDLIEPGSENPPAGSTLALELPATRTFSASLLQTQGNSVVGTFKVNGVAAGTGSSFEFAPTEAGTYEVQLEVRDTTPLVQPAMAGNLLVSTRRWTVNVTGTVTLAPTVAAVSPGSGPLEGGTEVTISGTRFESGASVRFGGLAAGEVVVNGPTSITCNTPAGIGEGPVAVTVATAAGQGSLADGYTYLNLAPCVPDSDTLCLGASGRFEVGISWRTAAPASGIGKTTPIPGAVDSGLFWFFTENNQEMLVKVLDACAINQRYWVFFAATTNVEFAVTVRDTRSGELRTYRNPLGTPALPVQDTSAFATCP